MLGKAFYIQWLPEYPSWVHLHQAFFSFLDPHTHLATMPSSFPQSHRVPKVTTSRNKKTSSRYCSCHGCCRTRGLRCAAPPVWRMWSIQPTSLWAGVRGWERLMMLAATAADLYLLAVTKVGVTHVVLGVLETLHHTHAHIFIHMHRRLSFKKSG